MSDLASYSLQTIGLAALALVYFLKSKKVDTYSLGLVVFWTIGVIFIYSRYGADQVQFYSNDQAFHQLIVESYLPNEGINLGSFISLRYIITLPVYFFSSFGLSNKPLVVENPIRKRTSSCLSFLKLLVQNSLVKFVSD